MNEHKINHVAVITVTLLSFMFGWIWYGPLFQDAWAKAVGLTLAEIQANPPGLGVWITNIVTILSTVYALAWLFTKLKVESLIDGVRYAFVIGFVFVLLSRMTSDMFAKNPYELTWITGGYDLARIVIAGAILSVWRKK